MTMFSKNEVLVGAASLLASIALTAVATTASGVSYTAQGTTDARTAELFNKLLKNSQHLQVETHVRPSVRKASSPYGLAVNYTVTGKTDVKTARKLIQLFRTSKRVEVVVDVYQHLGSNRVAYRNNNQKVNIAQPIYMPSYPAVYAQSANSPYHWYPVAMWKKVPVPAIKGAVKQEKTETQLKLAER